ncbi:META domain-containing protein [Dyadobacter frigoris]|uniref:META domain-containing protein n=1 Tax=Dyadobacter frigoris TaxID=2576211 RepID=A0A4U6DC74_9BACT|nr:META domain-containing protein [Dyadobacter frigoris]TKT93848.1 META domain-containing protein [Dyadobacter frigoris]GLU50935.1 hypothetical protein Dfri01_03960 [Dyadobacter frigoris]
MKKYLVVILLFSLFSACKSNKKVVENSNTNSASSSLEGTWQLNYLMVPGKSFEELYPDKKPEIKFELGEKRFSGNTSCNSFTGKLNLDGNKISFRDPYAMTKMMCPGEGESVFTQTLNKVNTYAVTDGSTLNFISGDMAIMRFTKK